MAVLLKEALTCDIFCNAIVLAGAKGMDNELQFVTVMDVMNIHEWLKSDGALLLSGHNLTSWLNEPMLRQLREKKVAAIVTKRRCVSGFSDEMIAAAEEAQIPIIIVAESYSWMEIIQPVTEILLSAQYALTKELLSMHNMLMDGLLHGNDLGALCRGAEHIVRHPVAILDNYFNPLGSSFAMEDKEFAAMLSHIWMKLEHELVRPYKPNMPIMDGQGHYYYLMPLISRGEHCGYIMIGAENPTAGLTEMEQIKLEQLALIVTYELLKRNEQQLSVRNYYNMFWNRFLHDQVSIDEIRTFVSSIKKNISLKNYLAVADVFNMDNQLLLYHNQRFNLLMDILQTRLPNFKQTVIFESGNHIIILIPVTVKNILAYVRNLDQVFATVFHQQGYCIGISSPHELQEGGIAYQEATCALNVIKTDRDSGNTYCFYDDLGILKLFVQHGAIDRHAFDDFFNKYLGPLLCYDKQHNAQLTSTFFTYLRNNMSPSKTAQALFIHKNTLIARLKRVETILNVDLDNYLEVFNATTAMMIHQVFNTIDTK